MHTRNTNLKRILITTYLIVLSLFVGINILVSLKINDLFKRSSVVDDRQIQLRNADEMMYLDEVLTNSARNFVYTNDSVWLKRYDLANIAFSNATTKSQSNNLSKETSPIFNLNDSITQQLFLYEEKAFEQIAKGNRDSAIALIESKSFKQYKDIYVNRIKELQSNREYGNDRVLLEIKESIGSSKKGLISLLIVEALLLILIGLLGIYIFRSARKIDNLNIEVKLNEEKYRFLIENMHDVVWVMDVETMKFTYMSPSIEKLTGFTVEEVMSRSATEAVTLKSQKYLEDNLQTRIEKFMENGNGEIYIDEIKQPCKDGSLIWTEMLTYFHINSENDKLELIGITRDISKRKRGDKILQQKTTELIIAKEKAEESDRLKLAFLSSMSHEIRTPLNSIVGFSGLIADSFEGTKLKEYSHIISTQNEILLRIVSDILSFSQLEAGIIEIREEIFDIDELINDLATAFNSKLLTDIELVPITTSKSLMIFTDKSRIKQLFSNLLSNALKFTHKGSITFGYEFDKQSEIRFFVKDTGIGIPIEQQSEIFERFTKLDHFTQGTGLGLSIVKKIIKAMNGELWLESETGKGSSFYFKLPIKFENTYKEKEKSKSTRKKPIVNYSEIKVLIVEDDESNMQFLKATLMDKNIKTLWAINGMEAVEICKSNNDIDMVLMDLKMPILDGLEATKQIKQFNPDLPIIAQTGYVSSSDEIKANEAGCDAYISKPIMKPKLFELISKYY